MSNLVNDCNIVRCLSRGCGGRDLIKVKWCCARIRNVLSCLSKRGGVDVVCLWLVGAVVKGLSA